MNCCTTSTSAVDALAQVEEVVMGDGYFDWESMPSPISYKQVKLKDSSANVEEILNKLENRVLQCFASGGQSGFEDSDVIDFMRRLGLANVNSLVAKVKERKSVYPTVKSFVSEIRDGVNGNTLYTKTLQIFHDNKVDIIPNGANKEIVDKQLREVVIYMFVLDAVTSIVLEDQNEYDKLNEAFTIARTETYKGWEKKFGLFLVAKLYSVKPGIDSLGPKNKNTEQVNVDEHMSANTRFLFSLNVLEAMLQDWKNDNTYNAEAGFELTLLDGLFDVTKKINGSRPAVAPMSSNYRFSMIPRNWSDLYISWNMAFVANFEKFPYYAAKLLTPIMGRKYQKEPHIFMRERVLTLWMQLHYILHLKFNPTETETALNWEPGLKKARDLMGKVNYIYAKRYRAFYDTIDRQISSKSVLLADKATDKMMIGIWNALKKVINSGASDAKLIRHLSKFAQDFNLYYSNKLPEQEKKHNKLTDLLPEKDANIDVEAVKKCCEAIAKMG